MINFFETFNNTSRELYISLKNAGHQHTTIVIEDDGFLPDDCVTPYRYFSDYKPTNNKARFFNEVKKPKYWEIMGNNDSAEILDKGVVRAYIKYRNDLKPRVVSQVEWLAPDNIIRYIDHYTKEGYKFAHTINDISGNSICKLYYDLQGKVMLYENFVTGNVMLTLNKTEKLFNNRLEFITFFLNQLDIETDNIIFNSLSTPLFAIYNRKRETRAFLFWQESIQNDLPGNMKAILEADGQVDFKILVPNQTEYDKIIKLVDSKYRYKVVLSGYIYRYHKSNQLTNHVVTLTNSDQLPHLEEIVKACPEYTFSIAAITEMSSNLMNIGKYSNVKLYPAVELRVARKLFEESDIYLDINKGNEILNAVRSAFDYDQLIIGYKETAHNISYTVDELLFSENDYEKLIKALKMNNKQMKDMLNRQKKKANAISVEQFNNCFIS